MRLSVYAFPRFLTQVPDPVMFGLFLSEGNDAGNKCVAKNSPEERVGVMCKKQGKYSVVEYSEISSEMANLRDASGELVFSAGTICNIWYTIDFIRDHCSPSQLPLLYHVAHKAIPFYDTKTDTFVKPAKPNGIKMESFFFDVFPASQKMGCLLVPRSEFTPVKNSNGWDDDAM